MPTDEHYDVIIIGTGAGGGTLAGSWRRPASRSCCSSGAATSPRDGELGHEPVFIDGQVHRPTRSGTTPTATSSTRGELLRRRQDQVVRRRAVPAAARGLRRDQHHDGISPAWPLELRRLRAVVHARPNGSTRCAAARARTRPKARGASEYPVAGGVARAAHPAALRRPRAARLPPSHLPVGILFDRRPTAAAQAACIRCTWCDGFPASCTPRPTRRSSASIRLDEHRTSSSSPTRRSPARDRALRP